MTGREQSADRGARAGAELRAFDLRRAAEAMTADERIALVAAQWVAEAEAKVARVEALADLWAASDVPTDQMRADDIRHALRGALGEQGATSVEEIRP